VILRIHNHSGIDSHTLYDYMGGTRDIGQVVMDSNDDPERNVYEEIV